MQTKRVVPVIWQAGSICIITYQNNGGSNKSYLRPLSELFLPMQSVSAFTHWEGMGRGFAWVVCWETCVGFDGCMPLYLRPLEKSWCVWNSLFGLTSSCASPTPPTRTATVLVKKQIFPLDGTRFSLLQLSSAHSILPQEPNSVNFEDQWALDQKTRNVTG